MILLCGIPSEGPLSLIAGALKSLRETCVLFNQREFAAANVEFTVDAGAPRGWLTLGNAHYRLEDFRGVYPRFMDDRSLPELKDEPDDSPLRRHCRNLHANLSLWFELTSARVVNRPSAMASNNSKPYQAQIILQHGLRTPETLITNDPDLVRDFHRRHGRIIYKSISGVRSIVQELSEKDFARLPLIRWCPVQFQEFVEGENVRVHVVGSELFPTRIASSAVDYRYASQQVGESAELEPCELAPEIAERCVRLAAALGLPFAGIDLKIRPDGEVYCFEVNPSPGFSYYEANTGQPIAQAVARHLAARGAEAGTA